MIKNPHMKSRQAAHRLFTSAFCCFLVPIARPRLRHYNFTNNVTTGEADLSFYTIKTFIFASIDRYHNHTAFES